MSLEIHVFCKTAVVGPESFGFSAGSELPWPFDPRSSDFTLGPLSFDIYQASDVDPETVEEYENIPKDFCCCVSISGRGSAFDGCPWPMSGSDWASHIAKAFRGVALFEDGDLVYDGRTATDESVARSLRLLQAGVWAAANPSEGVTNLDHCLRCAATGEPLYAEILSQWSGWVRPRGAPGSNRQSSEPLGRALLRACEPLDRVDPCVASAFDWMMFLPLVHDAEARNLLRERLERGCFEKMMDSLSNMERRDRDARALFDDAKTRGDVI